MRKLLSTLKNLRDLGNTLIVVEHDEDTMRESDFIVDIGPGAGAHGGEVVAAGSPGGSNAQHCLYYWRLSIWAQMYPCAPKRDAVPKMVLYKLKERQKII